MAAIDALQQQLQAALGDAYTFERELGGGGMSRVFVAEERRLKRQVVIKVLAPELAAGVSADRFQREIALAAALQEPHIVPVLTAGATADGLPYYTMPFVEGESLRARLAHAPLSVSEAVDVLRNVARALSYAHERGVVHRDIKPENVLLSSGTAVVTDFGIAKALQRARTIAPDGVERPTEAEGLTQAGTSLGTPAYMAPEQVAGDPATDHRADLYAWGIMAYEVLAGRHPFAGKASLQALMAAHLSETPAPLPQRVPRHVAAVVARCLAKEPAHRPASASDVLAALDTAPGARHDGRAARLRSWRVAGAGFATVTLVLATIVALRTRARQAADAAALANDHAVAVLPFANASGDTASNYFADGMTDELATALARVPGLQVASRTSSYRFRERGGLDARAIARQLGVAAIVEGSVRRAGRQLRVTAQLTHGSDGRSMWADAFTADADSVFAVQARLTAAIVAAVAPALAGRRASTNVGTHDPEAFDRYLRARYELNRRGAGVGLSIPLFEQAIARDSAFAEAWAGLASAWAIRSQYDEAFPASMTLAPAERAAARAIALDSTQAEAYTASGMAHTLAGRFADAEPLFARGLELAPRSPIAHLWSAWLPDERGDFAKAEQSLRAAMALDPLSANIVSNVARMVSLDPARFDEARTLARRAIAIDPQNGAAVLNAARLLVRTGDYAESLQLLNRVDSDDPEVRATAIVDLVALGRRDTAEALFSRIEQGRPTPHRMQGIANAAAALGRWDQAFAAAARAADAERSLSWMTQQMTPVWQPVVRDPRMRALCGHVSMDCDAVLAVIARAKPLPIASR